MKNKYFLYSLFFVSLIACYLVLFVFSEVILAQDSSDAISIRVIPNPNHYSSQRWYNEQGFIGTPQSLLVDEYEAIRNGNTVYVNAANVSNTLPQTLFTNIYIISYNLKADRETEDIFARILEHWKFNYNINGTIGFCSPDFSTTLCVSNDDCPEASYCSSDKAETIRDTTRLANIADFNFALENYREKNGHYPKLSAGSYLPNRTISTWPSWQGILSQELGVQLPVDPINNLGACVGYDNETCWDEEKKEFADTNLADPKLNLPTNSRAFVYQVAPDGSDFVVCGEMESGFVFGASNGACSAPNNTGGQAGTVVNFPPQIIGTNIPIGYSGHPYTAYIQGVDPNNDIITWSLDTTMTTWTNWSGAPSLRFTAVNNQVQVEATSAGDEGFYDFIISLDDNMGGLTTQSFTIQVVRFPPVINAIPFTYIASSTNPFDGTFTVQGDVFNYPLSYTLSSAFPNNFSETFTRSGNYFNFNIVGTLDPATNFFPHGTTPISRILEVTDAYGTASNKTITVNVVNSRPVIAPASCQSTVRVNNTSCVLPWDPTNTILNGVSVTAYKTNSVFCGQTCLSENRTCTGGVLSGSFTNPSCTTGTCSDVCNLPWGGTIADGASVTAYEDSNIACGFGSCVSETRTCSSGALSGSYTSGACMNNLCTGPTEVCASGSCSCSYKSYEEYSTYKECTWTDPTLHCAGPSQTINTAYCANPGTPSEYKVVECDNTGNYNLDIGDCCDSTVNTTCSGASVSLIDDGDTRVPVVVYGPTRTATGNSGTVNSAVSECPVSYTPVSCEWDAGADYFGNIEMQGGADTTLHSGSCLLDTTQNGYYLQLSNWPLTRSIRSICVLSSEVNFASMATMASSTGGTSSGGASTCLGGSRAVSYEWREQGSANDWANISELEGGMGTANEVGLTSSLNTLGTSYVLGSYEYPLSLEYRSICVDSSVVDYGAVVSYLGGSVGVNKSSRSDCPTGYKSISCEWRDDPSSAWYGHSEVYGGPAIPTYTEFACENENAENVGYKIRLEDFPLNAYLRSVCVKGYN